MTEGTHSIEFYRSEGVNGLSYFHMNLSGINKGAEGMTLVANNFYFSFKEILDNNTIFKVDYSTWSGSGSRTSEFSNIVYNSATGDLSFDFIIDGSNRVTAKPLNITGSFTGKVYDEIIRGTENEVVEEIK